MKIVKPAPSRRNVVAAALSNRSFAQRIIRNKKKYTRKGRNNG